MIPAATREAQATACLEVAARLREPLLALATKLAGNEAAGMELYQQTLLQCHDAIQHNGFAGDRYEFYLRKALKNQQRREFSRQARTEPLPAELPHLLPSPVEDARACLGEQVMAEAQQRFGPADRVALRLSLEGYSCQQIADMIGKRDQSWVWRRIERMKETLREIFQQGWDALGE